VITGNRNLQFQPFDFVFERNRAKLIGSTAAQRRPRYSLSGFFGFGLRHRGDRIRILFVKLDSGRDRSPFETRVDKSGKKIRGHSLRPRYTGARPLLLATHGGNSTPTTQASVPRKKTRASGMTVHQIVLDKKGISRPEGDPRFAANNGRSFVVWESYGGGGPLETTLERFSFRSPLF